MTNIPYESNISRPGGPAFGFILVIYYILLLLMLAASFLPQYRVWGLNHWAHYPSYIAIVLFCIGAVLPYAVTRIWRDGETIDETANGSSGTGRFLLVAAIMTAVYLAAFYLLRARTHFLGDGYQLLANLPTVNPWIKIRNLGEELIHKLVYAMLSGEASERSLKSFQFVSYGSGLIFLVTVAIAAKALFTSTRDRLLFFAGPATAGYMLLFFGYVENYSVFVACVAIYAVMGLLILSEILKRWYILIPALVAVSLHTLGAVLLAPTVYLLISGTRVATWLSSLNLYLKLILSVIVAALCVTGFWYPYYNSFFFRFSMVPFVDGPFTLEGYTLFSGKHLIDIVNLYYVLLPSLPVLVAITLWVRLKKSPIGREVIFLSVMALSAFVAVVLFNPKLGMPRDWDLFSFAGVPVAFLGYYVLLKIGIPPARYTRIAALAIFLSLAVLIPRAVGRAVGHIEAAHVVDYLSLDVKKNKNVNILLRDFYAERGDTTKVRTLYEQWQANFPERSLNERGLQLRNEGRPAEAIRFFQGALAHNPTHVPTYAVLASCYRQLEKYDTAQAILEIANGMDPNNTSVLAEFAYLHRYRGDLGTAEKYFERVISIDPSNLYASLGLLEVLWTSGQAAKHDELLIRVAANPGAPAGVHMRLGHKYMSEGLYDDAETQFRQAVRKGIDANLVQGLLDSLSVLRE